MVEDTAQQGALMQNHGRYVYARRQWLHWWAPLSHQLEMRDQVRNRPLEAAPRPVQVIDLSDQPRRGSMTSEA